MRYVLASPHGNMRHTSCNWCGCKLGTVDKGKPYCLDCEAKSFKICKTCHKPYNKAKYFREHPERCNSCHTRYMKTKEKKLKVALKKDVEPEIPVEDPSSDSCPDSPLPPVPDDKSPAAAAVSSSSSRRPIISDDEEEGEDMMMEEDEQEEDEEPKEENEAVGQTMREQRQTLMDLLSSKAGEADVTSEGKKKKRRLARNKERSKVILSLEEDLMRAVLAYKRGVPKAAQAIQLRL